MHYPNDLRYHHDDTWARYEDDRRVRIGITDFAQDQLGEIVFVDLPEPGAPVRLGEAFGEIESSKTVADLVAPVTGVVLEVNRDLERQPDLVNNDPYGAGWILIVDPSEGIGTGLLDAASYQREVENR